MRLNALFRLAFAPASPHGLTSPHTVTRWLILQKARHRPERLWLLVNQRFQVLFHSPPGVLFTFPSRYSCTGLLPAMARLSRPIPLTITFVTLWGFWRTLYQVPQPPMCNAVRLTHTRFRLIPFRSPLLRESHFALLSYRLLRCFSSPGSLNPPYVFRRE